VLVLPAYDPIALAKHIATLDRFSNGRVIVGVGIGRDAAQIDAFDGGDVHRAARATESIEVMRTIWIAERNASFDGRFFSFHGIDPAPRPVQPLGPRLTIGGNSLAAARRAGRLGHGLIPLGVAADRVARMFEVAKKEAEHGGWDTESMELTVSYRDDAATVRRLCDIGASRFVLSAPQSGDLGELRDAIRAAREALTRSDFVSRGDEW
jgi:alkanesulfonate monooxygenase SsuD/methylene tetrahydromethanopterin reductase-like flavin-dependent oxidoreductase (luciferase family)